MALRLYEEAFNDLRRAAALSPPMVRASAPRAPPCIVRTTILRRRVNAAVGLQLGARAA